MEFTRSIEEIEKTLGYTFRDKALLRQAFTRASFCNEHNFGKETPYQSNEVLEFFGDSVLSMAIVTSLIETKTHRYSKGIKTELKEGDFSNIRSHLADKKNLSDNIRRLGLEKHLIMSDGDKKLGIGSERSVMEDLFESLIGAVYIDSGFDMNAVKTVVENMLDLSVYLTASKGAIQSYKNMIQEWCADKSRRMPPPVYEKRAESGPDHNKSYTCVCIVGGKELGEGTARSLKGAESEAARSALAALGLI